MAEFLKVEDKRFEFSLRRIHQTSEWAIRAATSCSFFARAAIMWLRDLQALIPPDQVSVFSPSHRNHYLNVTPSNLVKVYSSGFNNENQPQSYQDIWETSETVTPQQDPPISAVIIMATMDNKNVEGCERNKKRCHRILASNESPSLLQESGSCGAGKSIERADLDDLDQLLGELPDDFFSSLEEQNTL